MISDGVRETGVKDGQAIRSISYALWAVYEVIRMVRGCYTSTYTELPHGVTTGMRIRNIEGAVRTLERQRINKTINHELIKCSDVLKGSKRDGLYKVLAKMKRVNCSEVRSEGVEPQCQS